MNVKQKSAALLPAITALQANAGMATPSDPVGSPTAPAPDTAAGSQAPMTDIHDILPPEAVEIAAPWLLPILITLAVVGLLATIWWWWRKRHRPKQIQTVVAELPPEAIARQALRAIADVRRMEARAFYFQLSAILRNYVHLRFDVGAPEMTTEEFLPAIDNLKTERELTAGLKQLCRAMEPVKFADAAATESQMEADLAFAREFVEKTTRAVTVPDTTTTNRDRKAG